MVRVSKMMDWSGQPGVTLRIDRDLSGVVGDDGLVVVVDQLAGVELVSAGHDGVGNLGRVIESWWQSPDLTANHDQLLGEEPLHEGPGLIPHTEDLDVIETLPSGHLVVEGLPDVLTDGAVDCSCQTSV